MKKAVRQPLLHSQSLWPAWGHLGTILGHRGAILGPSWGHLGPSWGHAGMLGHLGTILGHLGAAWGQNESKTQNMDFQIVLNDFK